MGQSRRFDADPVSVGLARSFVREVLAGYDRELVDDGVLLVSEVAANVVEHARTSFEALGLALLDQRVHRQHLDVEQRLHRSGDLRLRRAGRHLEADLVLLGEKGHLFGNQRRADDLVHPLPNAVHEKDANPLEDS